MDLFFFLSLYWIYYSVVSVLFWCFSFEAYELLAPWPWITPTPRALEGKVLTTGPPGKTLCPWIFFFYKTLVSAPGKILLGQDIIETVLSFPRLCLFHKNFSSVQLLKSCLTLCNPMDSNIPACPVHHQLPEPTQTHGHWVSDAIQPSHPLLSPSPPALNLSQHQGLFQDSVFASGGQSIGASNIWHSLFPLRLYLCGFSYQSWACKCLDS